MFVRPHCTFVLKTCPHPPPTRPAHQAGRKAGSHGGAAAAAAAGRSEAGSGPAAAFEHGREEPPRHPDRRLHRESSCCLRCDAEGSALDRSNRFENRRVDGREKSHHRQSTIHPSQLHQRRTTWRPSCRSGWAAWQPRRPSAPSTSSTRKSRAFFLYEQVYRAVA